MAVESRLLLTTLLLGRSRKNVNEILIFYKKDMLTKYRNVLHAFSLNLKRKASECFKSCLYSQVRHFMLQKLSVFTISRVYFFIVVFAKELFIRYVLKYFKMEIMSFVSIYIAFVDNTE